MTKADHRSALVALEAKARELNALLAYAEEQREPANVIRGLKKRQKRVEREMARLAKKLTR